MGYPCIVSFVPPASKRRETAGELCRIRLMNSGIQTLRLLTVVAFLVGLPCLALAPNSMSTRWGSAPRILASEEANPSTTADVAEPAVGSAEGGVTRDLNIVATQSGTTRDWFIPVGESVDDQPWFQSLRHRLQLAGADYLRLERWPADPPIYWFTCQVELGEGRVVKYERLSSSPREAMTGVLRELQSESSAVSSPRQ
jgi:hypothetical protein